MLRNAALIAIWRKFRRKQDLHTERRREGKRKKPGESSFRRNSNQTHSKWGEKGWKMVIDRKTDIKMPLRQFMGGEKGKDTLESKINALAIGYLLHWPFLLDFRRRRQRCLRLQLRQLFASVVRYSMFINHSDIWSIHIDGRSKQRRKIEDEIVSSQWIYVIFYFSIDTE